MRHLVLALALAVAPGLIACGDGCGEAAVTAPSTPVAPAPPPVTPADLAVHVAIAPTATSWPALRGALGDDARGWPRTFGGAAVAALGLPITVAEVVSADAPLAVVVLAPEGERPALVAALHLRAADRAVVLASSGADARFRADRQADGVVKLTPARAQDRVPMRLAIVGNHLVAATSDAALDRAGAFVSRAPAPGFEGGALAAATLGPAWPRVGRALASRLGGLVPALPGLLPRVAPGPAAGDLDAVLDALVGGRGELHVRDGAFEVVLTGRPSLGAAGAAVAVPHGPAAPWLAMPRSSTLAVMVQASAIDRAAEAALAAEALADALGLVATRRARFSGALADLARARGPSVTVALGTTPEGPAAWFRADLEDAASADEALEALVSAAGTKGPPTAGAAPGGAALSARATVIERVGEAVRLKVRVGAEEDGGAVDVLVRREADALIGASGHDASAALHILRGASDADSLRAHPVARRVADGAREHAALVYLDLGAASAAGAPTGGGSAAVGASLSLAGAARIAIVAEPRVVGLVRAKLDLGSP